MSPAEIALLVVAAGVATAVGTFLVRRFAARHLLDVPNERSSHVVATPTGGGLAIVSCLIAACAVLGARGALGMAPLTALVVGMAALAVVGWIDDRVRLSVSIRILVHLGTAALAAALLGGLPALVIGTHAVPLGALGYVIAALAIVWSLNLFNFMDGIDGIAGMEAAFVAAAGAWLTLPHGSGEFAAALALAACCAGFLAWNWPPARIFMGDVGSGPLGFALAVLALAAAAVGAARAWVWLILYGAFVTDATVTLVRRLVRGERVYNAHRSHAYQYLARRWGSHRAVTLAVLAVNVLWLLPCAWFAALHPEVAALTAGVALSPLFVLAAACGAGRQEERDARSNPARRQEM